MPCIKKIRISESDLIALRKYKTMRIGNYRIIVDSLDVNQVKVFGGCCV